MPGLQTWWPRPHPAPPGPYCWLAEARDESRREAKPHAGGRRLVVAGTESAAFDPHRLVFVAEAGVTTNMSRAYARAPRGQRA